MSTNGTPEPTKGTPERPELGELFRDRERVLAVVCYGLHLAGAVLLLTSIIALIVNYLRRREAGAVLASHHRWMIRTFWWTLAWALVAVITSIVYIGLFLLIAVEIWWLYRHIRGLLALMDDRPLPA